MKKKNSGRSYSNREFLALLWLIVFVGFVSLLLSPLVLAQSAGATPTREVYAAPAYMYIRPSATGFDWYCLRERPYEITGAQRMAEINTLVERLAYNTFYGYVIETRDCNLDMLAHDEGGNLYLWRFTAHQTDEHLDHRHMTRGAYWARLISIDFYPDDPNH